jgi:hypothetical protein
VQDGQRVLPLVAVDQVVPVRDDVVDRAAVMAERDAAIHAARSLRLEGLIGQRLRELAPRMDPLRHLLVVAVLAFDLEEPGRLAHQRPFRTRLATGLPRLVMITDVYQ